VKINKAKLAEAVTLIIKDHEQRHREWDQATARWHKERLAAWKRDEWPKWKKLQALIGSKTRTRGPITGDDLAEIFPGDRNHSAPHLEWFHPLTTRQSITFEDGETVYQPSTRPARGMTIEDVHSLKLALDAIADEFVTDTQLAKIGFKELAEVFRRTVEIGGLVSS
jgi:hypothetical protein